MIRFNALKELRFQCSSTTFIVVLALYFGFVLNIPLTTKFIELASEKSSGLFAYSSPLLLSAAFVIIFSCFNIPYFRKPFFIFLVLTSAMASYATLKYGVLFDSTMMENIFETNSHEAISYLNASSILYIIAFGIIPSLMIAKVQFKKERSLVVRSAYKLLVVIVSLLVITTIYSTSYKNYIYIGRNNSYLKKMITPAHIFNTAKYINRTYFTPPLKYKLIGEDAQSINAVNGKPSLIFVVIGEAARSMNIGYNGYARNTNPYTSQLGIISINDVSSCGTSTAHSLPCMFSNMGRNHYNKERADSQDNALDIIQRAGTTVSWFENDGGDKGVAKHVKKSTSFSSKYPESCPDGVCHDEVMLDAFKHQTILDGKTNQLVVFHLIGSHGPTYWKRYPKNREIFKPACRRSDIENCSDIEIRNVYDNTLVYTDYVLSELIKTLEAQSKHYNVALTYIADHGESLGEKGLYLHGTPYSIAPKYQTKVPWFFWMDSQFEHAYSINRHCLTELAKSGSYSQDNLFHTLLDLAEIQTSAKVAGKSLISTCRH
ncbi:phosphoethanolamine transferase [Vibrio spartinae]|uniref:Phosphoethanolamine transferase EptA n=1 Tax=Vibrio spartinae TaxID=1918945 RepID=A0ABX6R481_9VIBR|nr:phosphoethanolamine--lipid A transferase [Vibrio spartinae]QMV16338.1 Phosphoethanolamine transferase EptA [Vibrio spartinae]